MNVNNNLNFSSLKNPLDEFNKIKMNKINDLQSMVGDTTLDDKEKLKVVSQEFENIFFKMVVDSMNKSVPDSDEGLFGKSMGRDIFKDMLASERVKMMGENQSLGIAKMIYDQLTNPGVSIDGIQKKV